MRASDFDAETETEELASPLAALEGGADNTQRQLAELQQKLAATREEHEHQVEELDSRLENAAAERDALVQQLFEGARNEAWLAQERARLRAEVAHWRGLHQQVLGSRSWRLTAGIRVLGRGIRRLR